MINKQLKLGFDWTKNVKKQLEGYKSKIENVECQFKKNEEKL